MKLCRSVDEKDNYLVQVEFHVTEKLFKNHLIRCNLILLTRELWPIINGGVNLGVMEVIRSRRSIRRYKKKPIPEDLLMEVLEAARLAPSGANRQFWKLIVVRDDERKKGLVPLCRDQKFIEDCSAFIAAVDDPNQKWFRVDVAIALDHLSLAAAEKGLGTCWIGAFDPEKVAEYLGVPKGFVVTVCMTLGYPAESPEPRPRKSLEELIFWEKYGERA